MGILWIYSPAKLQIAKIKYLMQNLKSFYSTLINAEVFVWQLYFHKFLWHQFVWENKLLNVNNFGNPIFLIYIHAIKYYDSIQFSINLMILSWIEKQWLILLTNVFTNDIRSFVDIQSWSIVQTRPVLRSLAAFFGWFLW